MTQDQILEAIKAVWKDKNPQMGQSLYRDGYRDACDEITARIKTLASADDEQCNAPYAQAVA